MSHEPTTLSQELKQTRPFQTKAQEAALSVRRTATVLNTYLVRLLEPYGITPQQYNVLRILRGAHPEPLSRQEIGDRMVEINPGVTRLLDRMEEKGTVRRERSTDDRRIVQCWITRKGLDLLSELDAPIIQMDVELTADLSDEQKDTLIELLALMRARAR
jgi:DNA-binding MarR family transcriptional regulator